MDHNNYKLTFWGAFKTHNTRENVVRFVIKTLDLIAHPTVSGKNISKDLFKVT